MFIFLLIITYLVSDLLHHFSSSKRNFTGDAVGLLSPVKLQRWPELEKNTERRGRSRTKKRSAQFADQEEERESSSSIELQLVSSITGTGGRGAGKERIAEGGRGGRVRREG